MASRPAYFKMTGLESVFHILNKLLAICHDAPKTPIASSYLQIRQDVPPGNQSHPRLDRLQQSSNPLVNHAVKFAELRGGSVQSSWYSEQRNLVRWDEDKMPGLKFRQ